MTVSWRTIDLSWSAVMKTRFALSFSLSVLAALASLCVALPSHAAGTSSLTLQGTVGQYPVVMKIDGSEDADVQGAYFYRRFRQDINLGGKRTDSTLTLSTRYIDGDGSKGDRFALKQSGDGYNGTFMSAKGATLPVVLHRVAAGSVPMPATSDLALNPDKSWDDYDRLRFDGLRFVPGKKETVGGKYTIRWLTEPLSKVSMFHVIDGYPQPVIAAINRIVDHDFGNNLSAYFSCSGDNGAPGFDSMTVDKRYLSDRFVSYDVSSSWDCLGAAHPDFGIHGTTIDAKTGKELQIDDVLPFGNGPLPKPRTDAWYTYQNKVFGPNVVAILKRLHPREMQKPADDNDCDYSDPQVWSAPSWYLSARGMYVGAYFARAQKSCDNPDWSVIPYSVLRTKNPAMFAN